MSQSFDFYNDRADEAATDAKGAELSNVRERHLRAEKTWRSLAEQARKVESDRAKAKEDRRLRIESEEADAAEAAEAAEAARQD